MSDPWKWIEEIESNIADSYRPDYKKLIQCIKEMRGALEWIMPKVHQGNHEGEFETCEKATCVEYRKAIQEAGE